MTKPELLKKMFDGFGKSWNQDSLNFLSEELKQESSEAFNKAVAYFLTNSNTLPSPIAFVRKVRVLAMENREQVSRQDKKQHEQPQQEIKSNEAMARSCSYLVDKLVDGSITRQEFIKGMTRLEDTFPGCGFIEQAEELHNHYLIHGDDLSDKPPNFIAVNL